jgi:hypothetical protein
MLLVSASATFSVFFSRSSNDDILTLASAHIALSFILSKGAPVMIFVVPLTTDS